MNFSSFFVAFALDFLGDFQAPPEIWTTTNAGTARGTRTSRRQRSWNELKFPLPWEGEKFSGQRGTRSWKDGLFSFRGGLCVIFNCLKNFRWYYGVLSKYKTQGKSQIFLKKLQAGKFATKKSFTLDD